MFRSDQARVLYVDGNAGLGDAMLLKASTSALLVRNVDFTFAPKLFG
jgi:hypothetical protein